MGVLDPGPDSSVPFPSSQKHAHKERGSWSIWWVCKRGPQAPCSSASYWMYLLPRPTEGERTERVIRAKLRSIMMSRDLENVTSKEVRELIPQQARGHKVFMCPVALSTAEAGLPHGLPRLSEALSPPKSLSIPL